MAFKDRVYKSRELLCKSFADAQTLQRFIRIYVSRFVQEFSSPERMKSRIDDRLPVESDQQSRDSETASQGDYLALSEQTIELSRHILNNVRSLDSLDTVKNLDIARLRLMSNALWKHGNDDANLGVHDANLIFASRDELSLGVYELQALADCALSSFGSHTVPLWTWLSQLFEFVPDYLLTSTIEGPNDQVRMGALSVMKIIDFDIAKNIGDRGTAFYDACLGAGSSKALRETAIGCIASMSSAVSIDLIKSRVDSEFAKSSAIFVNSTLRLLLNRKGPSDAASYIIESRSSLAETELIQEVFSKRPKLQKDKLIEGLAHPKAEVRLAVLNALASDGLLGDAELYAALKDDSAEIRHFAVTQLESSGRTYSLDEARAIIVKPRKPLGLMGSFGSPTSDGFSAFENYKEQRLRRMSREELEIAVEDEGQYDNQAYLIWADRFFEKGKFQLRKDIDARFTSRFEAKLKRLAILDALKGTSDNLNAARGLMPTICKDDTRKAVELLSQKKKRADLDRIRLALADKSAVLSDSIFEYFQQYGQWKDTRLLLSAETEPRANSGLAFWLLSDEKAAGKASAILAIAGNNLRRVFELPLSNGVLARIIVSCMDALFKKLPAARLQTLLNHSDATVREKTCLKLIASSERGNVEKLLRGYESASEKRYYNVIHWLDLGVSMPQALAGRTARRAMELGSP